MKPRLLTERGRIRGVAEAWRMQYAPGGHWGTWGEDKKAIYDKLSALDVETASTDDVKAIIGNASWTALVCDGCDASVKDAVQVGDPVDYDSSTAVLCRDCVVEALELLDLAKKGAS